MFTIEVLYFDLAPLVRSLKAPSPFKSFKTYLRLHILINQSKKFKKLQINTKNTIKEEGKYREKKKQLCKSEFILP